MTFWIQHGYGKADKINTTARGGSLTGVVLSPADEEYSTLEATAESIRNAGIEPLLDPQLYIHTIGGALARCHESNEIEFGEISWFVSPDEISNQARSIIKLNQWLGTSRIIAPSPYQASFGDVWTPLSLQYAHATVNSAAEPVYLSIVAEDTAFSDWDQTQRYLDALTTIDAQGIYLIVGTSGKTYPLLWEPERLSNVLRAIYVLSEFNRYEVIWAYSDIAGLFGIGAGASGAATGWFNTLRFWSTTKWIPQTGGRQATPRILVDTLMSAIEREAEGGSIARSSLGDQVFPDPVARRRLQENSPWGISDSWIQYLLTMADLHKGIDLSASISMRMERFVEQLDTASQLIAESSQAGTAVNRSHAGRLRSYVDSINRFLDLERP